VMSASPTLTGTIAGAAMTLSSTLGVTGATTLSSTVATGALTVTGAATVSTTLGVTGATTLSSTVATGALTITGAATYTTNLKSTTALATPAALTATQATAFASTVSGSAIMGFGTTNDVSLMNRAGTVVLGIGPNTTTVNMTGLLSVTGFGTNSFSAGGTGGNVLTVRNTTAGTGNFTTINVGNNTAADALALESYSSTFTSTGLSKADGGLVYAGYSGGLSIAATNASGAIRFYSGGSTERMRVDTNGVVMINGTTGLGRLVVSDTTNSKDILVLVDTGSSFSSSNVFANFLNASNAAAGNIYHSASTTVVYNTASDMRLKRDLGLATDLSGLRALRVHEFAWIDGGTVDRNVFAQEAHAALPGRGVSPGRFPDGSLDLDPITVTKTWMVEKAGYVPDLIVGWQQHDATITQLAARIAALETKDH